MKKFIEPEIEVLSFASEDIMNGSTVPPATDDFVPGGPDFGGGEWE